MAIVSGVVLYAPFMRKLEFGAVRRERSARIKWLDLHKLLGAVTLTWAGVVGATGTINTWADLMIKYWQFDQLSSLPMPYTGQPTVPLGERGSVQASLDAALAQAPGMKPSFIAFPGTASSSPHHNTVFLLGQTLLDIATLAALPSGLLLWFKRKQPRALADEAGVVLDGSAAPG